MSRTRHPRIRRRVSLTLVGVALVSVLLLSGVNFFFARELLNDSVDSQLVALRDTRIQAFERGFARTQSVVSTLAANPSVVDALVELSAEYGALDEDITAEQIAGLEAIYEAEALPPFVAAGVDFGPTSDLVPGSTAGRYLQQQYIASSPYGFDEREMLDDAGDGSGYSAAHATHHPLLRELMENSRLSDLMFVEIDNLDVVYSVKKRMDLGANVTDELYAQNGLGEVAEKLSRVAVGDTVVSDSIFYVPTAGSPVLFLAAAVRSEAEVVGAIVAEVPVSTLTAITTARGDFELLGLGDTGETYLVGDDLTLRTDSRRWLEDPDDYLNTYLDRYGDEGIANAIEIVGTPVRLQTVDNEAVTAGLDGDEFVGTVTNYLGTETMAASGPVKVADLNWVVVAEFATSEMDDALNSYLWSMLVLLAVLLPVIAVLGAFIARNLTKPVDELVTASGRIADGHLDTEIEDFGRNELGDLGRQLEGLVEQLNARQDAIAYEDQRINDMMAAVLPARLVERVRGGEQTIVDIFDTATIVSLTVDAIPEATGADQDIVLEITERINEELDELVPNHGLERVRRSTGSELYVAGLDLDEARADDASRFALAAVEMVAAVGAEFGQPLTASAGLSAGDVATGVLGTNQLAFGIWGDPPGVAVALDSLARPGQVLADRSVTDQLGAEWDIGPTEELPGLADDIEAHAIRGAFAGSEPSSLAESD